MTRAAAVLFSESRGGRSPRRRLHASRRCARGRAREWSSCLGTCRVLGALRRARPMSGDASYTPRPILARPVLGQSAWPGSVWWVRSWRSPTAFAIANRSIGLLCSCEDQGRGLVASIFQRRATVRVLLAGCTYFTRGVVARRIASFSSSCAYSASPEGDGDLPRGSVAASCADGAHSQLAFLIPVSPSSLSSRRPHAPFEFGDLTRRRWAHMWLPLLLLLSGGRPRLGQGGD